MTNLGTVATYKRVRVINSYTGHARFLAECEQEENGDGCKFLGEVTRVPEIRSPYAYSPTHMVFGWRGRQVFIVETRHKRYEVFEIVSLVRA